MSKLEKVPSKSTKAERHKKTRHLTETGVYCRYHTNVYPDKERCLVEQSICHSEAIYKSLLKNHFCEALTKIALKHIMTILITAFCCGYKGKTTQFAQASAAHRTTVAHFLNHGKWDSRKLETTLRAVVINKIYREAMRTGKPIFCFADDTVSSKTKPSSKALHPIQDAYCHYSHLKRGKDYGHQAVGITLSCGELTLNYAIVLYDKSKSKIQIVREIAEELPNAPVPAYFLCDSGYACDKIISAFANKGFRTIGAIRTNRLVRCESGKAQIGQLAPSFHLAGVTPDLVTVGKRQFFVYRLEAGWKGVPNAVVLISYPRNAFGVASALRAFVCTNPSLSTTTILNFYMKRWNIEVFFRQAKQKLALDKYQIRSAVGIQRFWLLMSLAYLLCCLESGRTSFEDGYAFFQKAIQTERVEFIYRCAQNQIPMEKVVSLLPVSCAI